MQHVKASAVTSAPESEIWRLWTDVSSSPEWDVDVEWSRLSGPFSVGTAGEFKLKAGPRLRFKLDEVVRERSYANVVRCFGLLRVRFTHRLERSSPKTIEVTHGAEIGGPLGWLVRPLLAKPLTLALATGLHNMVRLAERS